MKGVVDLTRSKNPIMEYEDTDLAPQHSKLALIGKRISEMESLHEILEADEKYATCVKLSHERTLELLDLSLDLPLTQETLVQHGEMRGRIGERRRITQELDGIETYVNDVMQPKKFTIKQMIKDIGSKITRREEGK